MTIGGAITLAYAALFSTIEEQFLYFLYVPAILSLVVATSIFLQRSRGARVDPRTMWSSAPARVAVIVLCAFVLYDLGLWINTRTSRDSGLQQAVTWLQHDKGLSGPIANDTTVTTYLEQKSGLRAVAAGQPEQAAAEGVRYVTILSASVDGNYGYLDRTEANYYMTHGWLVFSTHDSTYGDIQIYRTTNPSLW